MTTTFDAVNDAPTLALRQHPSAGPEAVKARVEEANRLIREAYDLVPWDHPVGRVQWIHIDRCQANDYNPNAVAYQEMRLLYVSISEDGYTQPIVAMWDEATQMYVIVDGFHRFTVMKKYPEVYACSNGYLPVVVIDKPIGDRIASTVRHNRARGKHSILGMGNLVFQMLNAGESDETICNKIGLEPTELARLKHTTGYSKLYAEIEHSPVVLTKTQAEEKSAYKKAHPDETVPYF